MTTSTVIIIVAVIAALLIGFIAFVAYGSSQYGHKDEPFETWITNPVMLDVTDGCSLLQFIVSADIDPDGDSTYVWKNVSVEIKTVTKP